ncbi:MAG: hypothetical protein ACI4A8_01800 [Muribaculaceae bacterium]
MTFISNMEECVKANRYKINYYPANNVEAEETFDYDDYYWHEDRPLMAEMP